MNVQARQKLAGLIQQYGVSVCTTTAMCATVIRSQCRAFRAESKLFITALNTGVVQRIVELPPDADWATASQELAPLLLEQGLSPEQARWTIDSWAQALGRDTMGALPPPPGPPAKGRRAPRVAVTPSLADELLSEPAEPPRRQGLRLQLGNRWQNIALGLGVLGVGLLAFGINLKDENAAFAERGVSTEGEVVACQLQGEGGNRGGFETRITYAVKESKYQLKLVLNNQHMVGEHVRITYLRNDPTKAMLGEPTKYLTARNLVSGAGGLLLVGAAVLFGVATFWRNRVQPEMLEDPGSID